MLEINIWLVVATISVLSIQSIKLAQLKSRWIYGVAPCLVVATCYLSSDMIAAQNILLWQKFAKEQQQIIQVVVLLELSLAVLLHHKILPISSLTALVYGQLLFFQQGWIDWPFQWQGVVYGIAVLCLGSINIILNKTEKYWPQLLLFSVLIFTILSAATPPKPVFMDTNWSEISISLIMVTSIIALGIMFENFKHLKNKKN